MTEIEICRRVLADRSDPDLRAKILAGAYDQTFTMRVALAALQEGQRRRPQPHKEPR